MSLLTTLLALVAMQYGAIDGRAVVFDLSLDWYPWRPVVDDGRPLRCWPAPRRFPGRSGIAISPRSAP